MAITIVSLDPAPGQSGVDTTQPIELILDQPIDPLSVGNGSFFLESNSREIVSGPWGPLYYPGTSHDDILSNPRYLGVAKGDYQVLYMATDSSTTYDSSFKDCYGTAAYYTKLRFTPNKPLSSLTPYKLYIVGSSTNQLDFGICSRNTFDPLADGGNSGNGVVLSFGGYTSVSTATFFIEMTQSGVIGDAYYRWRKNAESWSIPVITHSYRRYLSDGLSVKFDISGTFQGGDSYSILAKPREFYGNYYVSTFVTGEYGSSLPVSDTSLVPSALANLPFSVTPGLNLVYCLPYNYSDSIPSTTTSFLFVFDKTLSTVVDTNGIQIYIGPANGDTSLSSETSYTPNNYSVSGSSLTIYLVNT